MNARSLTVLLGGLLLVMMVNVLTTYAASPDPTLVTQLKSWCPTCIDSEFSALVESNGVINPNGVKFDASVGGGRTYTIPAGAVTYEIWDGFAFHPSSSAAYSGQVVSASFRFAASTPTPTAAPATPIPTSIPNVPEPQPQTNPLRVQLPPNEVQSWCTGCDSDDLSTQLRPRGDTSVGYLFVEYNPGATPKCATFAVPAGVAYYVVATDGTTTSGYSDLFSTQVQACQFPSTFWLVSNAPRGLVELARNRCYITIQNGGVGGANAAIPCPRYSFSALIEGNGVANPLGLKFVEPSYFQYGFSLTAPPGAQVELGPREATIRWVQSPFLLRLPRAYKGFMEPPSDLLVLARQWCPTCTEDEFFGVMGHRIGWKAPDGVSFRIFTLPAGIQFDAQLANDQVVTGAFGPTVPIGVKSITIGRIS